MAGVLYVGEDLCRHIPIMECDGHAVSRSERSAVAVLTVLRENPPFDAITFEHHTQPLPGGMVPAVRQHSASPLVLFENPYIAQLYGFDHDDDAFDLIIPSLTPPLIWLKTLNALIEECRELRDASMKLRQKTAATRSETDALLRSSKALLKSLHPIDINANWRGALKEGKASSRHRRTKRT
jgi:hypothetical protein